MKQDVYITEFFSNGTWDFTNEIGQITNLGGYGFSSLRDAQQFAREKGYEILGYIDYEELKQHLQSESETCAAENAHYREFGDPIYGEPMKDEY